MGSLENSIALALIFILVGVCEAGVIGDALCKVVYCGQGTCNSSVDVPPFFKCDCYPGWTQLKLFDLPIFPPCIMPNCTVDFKSCGFPPLPPIILPTNSTDPCDVVWCANGTCAADAAGSGHRCNCDAGAFNLLNTPAMPCFQECYLESDCAGLGLGPPPPPPPPPPGTSNASRPSPTAAGASSGDSSRWIGSIGFMMFLSSLQLVI